MKFIKKPLLILLVSCLFVGVPKHNYAGILSGLAKLGKTAKKIDAPNPAALRRADLPDVHKHLDSSEIIPNTNGSWDVRLSDGNTVSLDSLKAGDNLLSDKAFIIRSLDIPKNPALLKQIPDKVPIYISGKNNRLFSLTRGTSNALNYKNVSLQLTESLSIQKAIYHLERPHFSNKTRFVTLSSKAEKTLDSTVYSSKVGIETASLQSFIKQLDNLKHQSIVLAGSIENGIFYPKAGASRGIPLTELRKAADSNGINLAILESNRPASLLKLLTKSEEASLGAGQVVNHSIGDFFDKLSIGKNPNPIKITSSADGRSNVAIQFRNNITKDSLEQSGLSTSLHLSGILVRTVNIYRPNKLQETAIEEERRAINRKNNALIAYPILSIILGWWSLNTSRFFWSKIWNINNIILTGSGILHALKRILNKILFLVIFLPLFGVWCFLFAIIKNLLIILHTLFIKPVLWIFTKFN